jgi:hypothetical protein
MHGHVLMASAVLVATSAGAAEPILFHRAQVADAKAIDLSLLSNNISNYEDYDFDVLIGLSKTNVEGGTIYVDPTRHPARVKCSAPAKVLVGGINYPVGSVSSHSTTVQWKEDLWRVVCMELVS